MSIIRLLDFTVQPLYVGRRYLNPRRLDSQALCQLSEFSYRHLKRLPVCYQSKFFSLRLLWQVEEVAQCIGVDLLIAKADLVRPRYPACVWAVIRRPIASLDDPLAITLAGTLVLEMARLSSDTRKYLLDLKSYFRRVYFSESDYSNRLVKESVCQDTRDADTKKY